MTVKELKKVLCGVPDDVEIVALKDGAYSERTKVWGAGYEDYDHEYEDGEVVHIKRFTINC